MKSDYWDCIRHCGLEALPETAEPFYREFLTERPAERPFISEAMLQSLRERFGVPEERMDRLLEAIRLVERDETLLHISKFLVWDLCRTRWRMDYDHYDAVYPACMGEQKRFYPLLLLLACVEPALEHLRARGIPEAYYREIPDTMLRPQMEKFAARGDVTVPQFTWDVNFYTCSIFLLDRFYFIPYQFFEPFTVYRNSETDEVVALYQGGMDFRADGQLSGVNGDHAKQFVTVYRETEKRVTGNPINPVGFVEERTITLDRRYWKRAVTPGDAFLALHIPSGPGYTPERIRNSCQLALDFYRRYFPEYDFQGFWSESWLYDPRLSLLLDGQSNIVRCQRQMYVFPTAEGDGMTLEELYHVDCLEKYREVPHRTRLQQAAARYLERGGRFCVSGMFLLAREVPEIGEQPYTRAEHLERFERLSL